jgi:DNA modification methylase
VVLDTFMGAGFKSGVATVRHGQEFIDIELNAEWVEMAW